MNRQDHGSWCLLVQSRPLLDLTPVTAPPLIRKTPLSQRAKTKIKGGSTSPAVSPHSEPAWTLLWVASASALNKLLLCSLWSSVYVCVLPSRSSTRFFWISWTRVWGFPGGASGKEPTCQCRRHKRHRFGPWVKKIPWRRVQQPTPVFLPGESHGQRSLAGYSP